MSKLIPLLYECPKSPNKGDLYFDMNNNNIYCFNGVWQIVKHGYICKSIAKRQFRENRFKKILDKL